MHDAFNNPISLGDQILIAYRANAGGLVVEPREVVYISSSGAPYYRTAGKSNLPGNDGPMIRAAKPPIYVVRT